jgi:hypothetical protein
MAQYTRNQNLTRALNAVLPGAYMGVIMLKSSWGIALGCVLAYAFSFILLQPWRIKNRWGRGIIITLALNIILSFCHSALTFHQQGREVFTAFGHFLLANIIYAVGSIQSWLIGFLLFVLIDFLIGLLIKPKVQ